MSSDIYPSCLSRNLVRTGAFGYHENSTPSLLFAIAEGAVEAGASGFVPAMTFVTYPDFGAKPGVRPQAVNFGQSHLPMLAISLGQRPDTGSHPL